ncbi:glycosyltransferase family 2 protein [Christiangramia sp. OXR-203]|uniref:glycosyltransferase family 2 protein n=1 Tax=Christiangramia sp. OXR-203 TaxID=3100176 RepID=UPI002AC92569|nr:glycosyltransferase family 2 protein [Christiangramia sp. OXR-203]WPY98250.1 glycosyltransferase family 2 protein [Christiangramia sp. OXR-203]
MKISIITATFNSAANIASVISSLEEQDYPNIEWLVIDGKSKDDTLLKVERYQGQKNIISEKDNGIYDALNKGVNLATGEIIGLVHSDDFLATSNIISEVALAFQENGVDGVYGDLQYVNKEDTSKIIRYWKSKQFASDLLKKGWMPAHPTLFLRKEVYEKHGNFNLNYNIAADYDLMLRIFSDSNLKFKYLPKVITKMRVGGASNRSIKNIIMKSKEDFSAISANKIGNPYRILISKNLTKVKQFYLR